MKKVIFTMVVLLGLVACNSTAKKQTENTEPAQAVSETSMTVDDLLASAEANLDKEVQFMGTVTHTCSHSGKRCFLQGKGDVTIRIEAKGDIGGFNRELVGNDILVTGILKERRLSATEINEMEQAIEAKSIKDDGSEASCDTERANIQEMRDWMKANGKDYFAIYYVDGTQYEEL